MSMRAQPELSDQGLEPDGPAVDQGPDRRRFVRNLAVGGAALAAGAAATGVLAAPAMAQTSTTVAGAPTIPAGDVTLVNFVLGLEMACAQLYANMVSTGKLTGAALGNARLYQSHHNDHAIALATLNADAAVNTANAKLLSQVGAQITAATSQNALVQIALDMENSMAATHQWMMETASNWQTASVEASLEPVEAQHCVVWSGELTPPLSLPQSVPPFQSSTGHYDPATYAAS